MKTYIIECVGNWYFEGWELKPVKMQKELKSSNLTVEFIRENLKQFFPDFFSGILDFKVTVLDFKETKERIENKTYIKSESVIEVLKEFDNFEFEFI